MIWNTIISPSLTGLHSCSNQNIRDPQNSYFYRIKLTFLVLGERPFKEMTTYEEYVDETSSKDTDNKPKSLEDMQKKPTE